jgi:hypothetical protein
MRGDLHRTHTQGLAHAQFVTVLLSWFTGQGQRPQQRAQLLWSEVLEVHGEVEAHAWLNRDDAR